LRQVCLKHNQQSCRFRPFAAESRRLWLGRTLKQNAEPILTIGPALV